MDNEVKLVSIRKMVMMDLGSFPDDFEEIDPLALFYGDQEYILDTLEDNDYTVLTLDINGHIYTAYHGFPGDNSAGVFKLNGNVWYRFGECCDSLQKPNKDCGNNFPKGTKINPVFKKFLDWYIKMTENEMNYEIFCIRD